MVRPDKVYFTDHATMKCCSCSTGLSETRGRTARRIAQGLAGHQGTCLKFDFFLSRIFSDFRFPPFPAPRLTCGFEGSRAKQLKSQKGDTMLYWKGHNGQRERKTQRNDDFRGLKTIIFYLVCCLQR